MPRVIDYGPPYGQVSYPDDVPDEKILSDIADWKAVRGGVNGAASAESEGPSLSDYYKQGFGALGRGFTDTLASMPEGAQILNETVRNKLTGGLLPAIELPGGIAIEPITPLSGLGRAAGGLLRRTGQAITPAPVPELEKSFIASQVPQGIGSTGAFLLAGLAGGAAEVPAWLAPALGGSLSSGQQFYQDAKDKGADESTAEIASLLGNVVGTTEAVPVASWVNRINKATGGTFLHGLLHATAETFEEAAQEAFQQLAQNFTAKQLYDKDRSLLEDVGNNAGVGGVTGFLLSSLSSAIGAGRARLRGQQRETTTTPQQQGAAPVEAPVTPAPVTPPGQAPTGPVQPDLIPGLPPPTPQALPTETSPTTTPVQPGQLELQPYAPSTGTQIAPGSPEEGLRQETTGRLRLRNAAQNRLETQQAAPVVPGTPAEERIPILQEIRQANARKIRDVIKLFPQAQLTEQRAEELRNLAFPELAGQPEASISAIPYIRPAEESLPDVALVRRRNARTIAEVQNLFPGKYRRREEARALLRQAFPEMAPAVAPAPAEAATPEIVPGTQTGPAAPNLIVPENPRENPQAAIDAIRRYPARTVNDIQRLFPNARLTSNEAVQLRDAAFPQGANVGAFVPTAPAPTTAAQPGVTVPATAPEQREPVLATIRRANARTIAQIQQLFPQAQLNREAARRLRDEAFPEGVYGVYKKEGPFQIYESRVTERKRKAAEILDETRENYRLLLSNPQKINEMFGFGISPNDIVENRDLTNADRLRTLGFSDPDVRQMLSDASYGSLTNDEILKGKVESRIEGRTNLSIGTTAVEQYLRENYNIPVQAQVQIVNDPTAQWDGRVIFENGQLIRIELNPASISSTEQIDNIIPHEFSHAVELSGEVANALSFLTPEELDAIRADMTRLGYETGDRHEFDTRGVERLVNAWKGRNWFEKIVGVVSELANRIGVPLGRLGAERAAARAVGRYLKGKSQPFRQSVSGTFESRVDELPNYYKTREQVEATAATPGLQNFQQQQVRELAAVQSSLVSDDFMSWFSTPAADEFNQKAKNILEYIANRRNLSDIQQMYNSLPTGTDEEKRGKEAIGAIILAHYGTDRATEKQINDDIDKKLNQLQAATAKLPRMSQQNMKAHFLTALFNRLTTDHRTYLANLSRNAPAGQNLQAQFNQNLTTAQNRLNEQSQAPGTLQRAISALATTVPDTLLQSGTNQQIIQWALNNGALQTVVPQATQQWMLVDDGSGQPALESYTRLRQDLSDLRAIQNNQQQVQNDIDAYEQWFKQSGRTGKISPKLFAEKYFSFRTQRDRAARIAGAVEKEIGDLDSDLRGLKIAQEKLQAMMSSKPYVDTVTEAAKEADVVVRAVHNQGNPTVGVGLIDRDQNRGMHIINIPGGNSYTIDLYPSSATEDENIKNLGAAVADMRQYAVDHAQDNPLLANEYNRLADYAERNLMHPSLNPKNGFTQTGLRIPGTNIRIPSPFDLFSSATGLIGLPFNTIRDAIERIGGRATRQMMKDAFELDTVMKRVEGINNNAKYGLAAQTQANLKAITSHGWSPDNFKNWNEKVAEPVLAAGQTIGPKYNIGDVIIGSGVKLTKEDVAALNLMKEWQDAVRVAAPAHIREQLGDLQILRKAVGFGRYTMARTSADWTEDWVNKWNAATTEQQRLDLLNKNENFRNVVMSYLGEMNPELALMNNASPDKSPLFSIYRRLAETEKSGVQQFKNTDEVLDFIATEMVNRNISPDYVTARKQAQDTLLAEIDKFTNAFKNNVLNQKTESIWGGVPTPVVDVSTAKNTFTTPRGPLQAPSSFYSYSVAPDGRRQMHVGSLRSLLNLKLLQSMEEARVAMEAKKTEMENEMNRQISAGKSAGAAKRSVIKETQRQRKLQEIQHDYNELTNALKILETNRTQLQQYETSAPNHYQHAGIETLNAVSNVIKSGLLAGTQAITTNTSGGTLLGPATFHWQTGEYLRALRDILPAPVGTNVVWNQLYKRLSAVVAPNPVMKKLLQSHLPLFRGLAEHIARQADAWKRIQTIAEVSGLYSPYNLRDQWRNRRALAAAGGRLTTEKDAATTAQLFNRLLATPGLGHAAEAVKAVFPRKFDDFINYALIMAFDKETEMLKVRGSKAFQAKEDAAKTSGRNYQDLSQKENVLSPEDLGLQNNKGLERYRQIFAPLGSLDRVLLDYYERTKGMTPEQRQSEPLIPDPNDHAALALHYAAVSNPATETNRPLAFKRKGGSPEAAGRAIAGTFMGWVTNFMHQLSKGLQSHSGDKNFGQIAHNYLGLAVITILLAAVGAWNWERGIL